MTWIGTINEEDASGALNSVYDKVKS